ncbi:type II secretion system protein [Pandoraea sp. NPDC090278]|uniref:type II secretion system protein n=1 Tax=Pandoraea sp. NPDC090278 TaxID=3364391 RepID=UPI00383A0528
MNLLAKTHRRHTCRAHRHLRGFTLIELLVVLGIIATLATLMIPNYVPAIAKAKNTVLTENLRTLRRVIDQFYDDTGHYPVNLAELVERKYLRAVPIDPVTGSDTTWITMTSAENAAQDPSAQILATSRSAQDALRFGASTPTPPPGAIPVVEDKGICCVKSGASGTDPAGKAYADY